LLAGKKITIHYKHGKTKFSGLWFLQQVLSRVLIDRPYASGTGKYSLPCFNVYLWSYDSSRSLTSPGNIAGIGTSKVTKCAESQTEMGAEKYALAVSKIVLTLGTGDTSKVSLLKMNIPGISYLDGSSFEQDVLTGSIKWTYSIDNQLYGADYIELPVNTQNQVRVHRINRM
jgi:hypothetical protein